MGITVDQSTVAGVVYSTSKPVTVILNDSMRVSEFQYKLSDTQMLEEDIKIYQSTSLSGLMSYENLQEFEFTVEGVPQVLPLSINIMRIFLETVADISELNTMVCFRVLDQERAINQIIYSQTLLSPVTEVKKGEITIKAQTPLDIAMRFQQLKAMSGDNVLCDSVTRYSTGKIKGRRRNV